MAREQEKPSRHSAMCAWCLVIVSPRSAHVSVTCPRCCSDLLEHYAEGRAAALRDWRGRGEAKRAGELGT